MVSEIARSDKESKFNLGPRSMEKGFSFSTGYVWNVTGITCRFIS